MEESNLQVRRERQSDSDFNGDAVLEFEEFKEIVESLLEAEEIPKALHIYTNAYSLDYLQTESLEILVDGVAKIARKILTKTKKFTFDSFFCTRCHDVIKDPVTLNCGHTFSKKCMLLKCKNDSFTCPNCRKSYSFAYLSQLKNNVTLLSLVEKLYEKNLSKFRIEDLDISCQISHAKVHGTESYFKCRCDDPLISAINPYATNMRVCKYFVDFKESFKADLLFLTMEPDFYACKAGAVQALHAVLQNKLCPPPQDQTPRQTGSLKPPNKNILGHSENSLRNLGSSDSFHVADDEIPSDDEDDYIVSSENVSLQVIFNHFLECIKKIAGERRFLRRIVNRECLDSKDFECPLCMRLLWEPVTTTCGHTFCRDCLNRWFDYQPNCPMCKTSLTTFVAERVQNTTEFLELAIESLFPRDFARRKAIYDEELDELSK